MEWSDRGIVLGIRRHGENGAIAEIMTQGHGRHLGHVRNGRSRSMQPVLQPGNVVEVTWRARLDEHLGHYQIEPVTFRAARLMEGALGLNGVQALASLLRLLPERDPHPHLFNALDVILDHLDEPAGAGELYVRFELAVLDDLGFGLDLLRCAATGQGHDLAYVSPKTGRAVSRVAGAPWADKMLALPAFLTEGRPEPASADTLAEAFRLSAFFLDRHVYGPRGLDPAEAREAFVRAVLTATRQAKDANE